MSLLATIKASDDFRALADAGHDAQLADAINATLPKPVPITAPLLAQAAPTTMATIAGGANPLVEMDVIASRLRAEDWLGVGAWADMLLMLGKMSQVEHDAVQALVNAAMPVINITLDQVSAALNAIRPHAPEADGGGPRALPIDWSQVA